MVKGYYQQRTRIWLNATLGMHAGGHAEAADPGPYPNPDSNPGEAAYRAYPKFDCNFNDIGKHQCKGLDRDACVSALEALCDRDAKCVGFNYPGRILKSACPACMRRPPCNGWEPSPASTFYFKPGHGPPAPVTSSCIQGFCYVQSHGNGTHQGSDCDKQCPLKPAPPNVNKLLAQFDDEWAHRPWDSDVDPAHPVGDPVEMANMMLRKYP